MLLLWGTLHSVSRVLGLALEWVLGRIPGELENTDCWDPDPMGETSGNLGQGFNIYMSNNFPGDTAAAALRNKL